MSLTFAGWVKIRFPLDFFPIEIHKRWRGGGNSNWLMEKTPSKIETILISFLRFPASLLHATWKLRHINEAFMVSRKQLSSTHRPLYWAGLEKHKDVVIYFKEKRVYVGTSKQSCWRLSQEKMRQKKSYRLELAALSLSKNVETSHQ